MNRLFLPYNKSILKLNTIFSTVLTFLSSLAFLSKESSHTPTYLIIFVLLDVPFNGISPLHIELVKNMIRDISFKKGIILTDHDFRNVLDVANKNYLLFDGRLKAVKNKQDLIDWGYVPDNK